MGKNNLEIIVIGAGLCGTLVAIRLAQEGHNVNLYEKRADMRKTHVDSGRSINLALSDRGLKALELVGLKDEALDLSIPMNGRMLHDKEGNTRMSLYSARESDYINSISRPGLNELLLDTANSMDNLRTYFSHKCIDVDFYSKTVILQDAQHRTIDRDADLIVGADGAGSAVRNSMLMHGASLRFSFSQDFLKHSYKELTIPAGETEKFQLEKNALHIWPRGDYMLIALPNLDGSFTATLFMRTEGEEDSFEALDNRKAIEKFFEENFNDAYEKMPDLLKEMNENPVGALGTVKCSPWQINHSTFLIGDAAHAIVPFYGQGMNSAFEDVTILDELMRKHDGDWEKILEEYSDNRKKDTDAIADLAIDNFHEMRDKVDDKFFTKKRKLEMKLEEEYEDYFSKYSLVTFREDLPYHIAKEVGRFQDQLLLDLVQNSDSSDPDKTMKIIKEKTTENFPDYEIYKS